MSSPSSSGSTKRKRSSGPPASLAKSSTADLLQPSSRDASGEDADEPTASASNSKYKKAITSIDASNPPAKRPRTRSTVTADATASNGASVPSIQKEDPGEPSDTTEASTDIANRSKLSKATEKVKDEEGNPQYMDAPSKGGIIDPVGYHTNPPPLGRPVRVYADGVFDLFHLGHMRQLEQAKTSFPNTYLIVGVTGDAETHKRKGLTVLTGAERAETIRHCKWVDEVIPNCPWIVTPAFMADHKIDYVAHDDLPYGAAEGDDIYKPIKEKGQFLVTQRTEGVSTTGIITKIVRDYEKYISRQLKRGTSRQELNISWLKKNELDLKRHVVELRDSIRNNWTTAGHEVTRDLWALWEKSRPGSPARPSFIRSPSETDVNRAAKSPTAISHLGHLDLPTKAASSDFAAGYSLGLVGGVRAWMTRNRTSLRGSGSQVTSPGSSEAEDEDRNKSPISEKGSLRGRKTNRSDDAMELAT